MDFNNLGEILAIAVACAIPLLLIFLSFVFWGGIFLLIYHKDLRKGFKHAFTCLMIIFFFIFPPVFIVLWIIYIIFGDKLFPSDTTPSYTPSSYTSPSSYGSDDNEVPMWKQVDDYNFWHDEGPYSKDNDDDDNGSDKWWDPLDIF